MYHVAGASYLGRVSQWRTGTAATAGRNCDQKIGSVRAAELLSPRLPTTPRPNQMSPFKRLFHPRKPPLLRHKDSSPAKHRKRPRGLCGGCWRRSWFWEVVVSERVGLELQRIREERGLTVEELAQKSGVSVTTIRVAERGPREPSDDTVARLARPLGLTFDEVWRLQRRRG